MYNQYAFYFEIYRQLTSYFGIEYHNRTAIGFVFWKRISLGIVFGIKCHWALKSILIHINTVRGGIKKF